jgi:hypothetical protein
MKNFIPTFIQLHGEFDETDFKRLLTVLRTIEARHPETVYRIEVVSPEDADPGAVSKFLEKVWVNKEGCVRQEITITRKEF